MFDPSGEWVQTYRIESGSGETVGLLRLERTRVRDTGFALKIQQQSVDDAGRTHEINAVADCHADPVASLVSWRLASQFSDLSGEVMPALTVADSRPAPRSTGPLTSDWCLFEAVQRLQSSPPPFELIEGLRVPRGQHRVFYRGFQDGLHRFDRIGRVTPLWEYRVDATRRLVQASSGGLTCILDDEASRRLGEHLQRIRSGR